MQVFKLYFQLLKKSFPLFLIYVGVFAGLLFGVAVPSAVENDSNSYISATCTYAIMDKDNSEISKSLCNYLESKHEKVEIENFDITTLQDELYYRNIRNAVIIEKGFGDALINGNCQDYLTIYDIPDNTASIVFNSCISEYLFFLRHALLDNEPLNLAEKRTLDLLAMNIETSIYTGSNSNSNSPVHYFYNYLPWILVVLTIVAISPILIKLNKKDLKDRIGCSSYHFSSISFEIIAAIVLTGLLICTFMIIASLVLLPKFDTAHLILYVINMVCLMAVALSITYLVSILAKDEMVINMVGNIVALGLAFISGVFVDLEFIGEGVISIARLFPVYWYVICLDRIEAYTPDKLSEIFTYYGIQILFCIAITSITLFISVKKNRIK